MSTQPTFTAFAEYKRIASGPISEFLPALKHWWEGNQTALHLIFDDQTGRQVDFDLRGPVREVVARAVAAQQPTHAGPGRPKLGVTSREISLLPRHWEWLEGQPNGASAAIRRLIDDARKREPDAQAIRNAMDATSRVMSALAGDLPGYEDATRALYKPDRNAFLSYLEGWPTDIRKYIAEMGGPAFGSQDHNIIQANFPL